MLQQDNFSRDFLIVALDFPTFADAQKLVQTLGTNVSFYKVGMELFYAEGKKIITYLKEQNKKIFLDLKLNDIPATVASAVKVLANLDVDYLTLFTNAEQITAARNVLDATGSSMKLLNVTVLTSQAADQQETMKQVIHRTKLSLHAKADGIVCSGLETKQLRQHLENNFFELPQNAQNKNFIIVNPGIRRAQDATGDQKRIVTPSQALKNGASHIVMGRPITKAENPKEQAEQIFKELYPVKS